MVGVLLVVLSFSLFLPPVSAGAVTSSTSIAPTYTWSNTGPVGQELSGPYNLATAPNGNIYVVDTGNNAIKEFTSSGALVRQWGSYGSANGQFDTPTGIAVASNGDVYVMDMNNYRVQKFEGDGTYITQWGSIGNDDDGEFLLAAALTVASNGNVYVADSARGIVQEFTSDGNFVKKWNIQSGAVTVYGIAVSKSGDIYLTLTTLGIVERYAADGTFDSSWGSDGTGDGQFGVTSGGAGPVGVTVIDNGHVYVTDGGNNRVQEFTSDGTFVAQWGSAGSGDGQFNTPFGIVSDSSGNMYIADNGNNRIQRYFFPQNVSNVATDASEIKITLPQGCDISDHSMLTPSKRDEMFNYPLGLTSFTFSTPDCVSGATVPVTLTFKTNLKPNEVVARKYNATTQTYTTIPGAVITETTIDGEHALQLSYSVTDGGPLDEDGIANGVIVDPVGLGTLNSMPSIGAPNAGVGPTESYNQPTIMLAMITSFVIMIFALTYRFVKR